MTLATSRGPADASSSISSSLLERVKGREPEAWQRLVLLFGPIVYRWSRQSGLQAADAADVVQDVFQAVATHVADFRHDRPGASFRGWLWTIARSKIHDHFRRRAGPLAAGGSDAQSLLAQVPEEEPPTMSESPPVGPGNELERRAMELVRAGIEPRTWEAFWRLAVQGEPVAQVAKDLGMTVRAVHDAKYRVRRRLRQELDGLGWGEE